jgi:hypothetical protein
MKKYIIITAVGICILAFALTDSSAVYTKTIPKIYGTVTAYADSCPHYPLWSIKKEEDHIYRVNDIVQYNGSIYQRKDSGVSDNYTTPDNNKSWVLIDCDKCSM